MRRSRTEGDVATAWGDWVTGLGVWHVFGGLTYRDQTDTRVRGQEAVLRDCRTWLRKSEKVLGRGIEAGVLAVEYHRSGWPHIHPLLRLEGGLRYPDLHQLKQAWSDWHGYATLEEPRDVGAVAAYASKYLAKDLAQGDVFLWPLKGSLSVHQEQLLRVSGPKRS